MDYKKLYEYFRKYPKRLYKEVHRFFWKYYYYPCQIDLYYNADVNTFISFPNPGGSSYLSGNTIRICKRNGEYAEHGGDFPGAVSDVTEEAIDNFMERLETLAY